MSLGVTLQLTLILQSHGLPCSGRRRLGLPAWEPPETCPGGKELFPHSQEETPLEGAAGAQTLQPGVHPEWTAQLCSYRAGVSVTARLPCRVLPEIQGGPSQ